MSPTSELVDSNHYGLLGNKDVGALMGVGALNLLYFFVPGQFFKALFRGVFIPSPFVLG